MFIVAKQYMYIHNDIQLIEPLKCSGNLRVWKEFRFGVQNFPLMLWMIVTKSVHNLRGVY